MNKLTFFGLMWSIAFAALSMASIALGAGSPLTYFAAGFHVAATGGWLLIANLERAGVA